MVWGLFQGMGRHHLGYQDRSLPYKLEDLVVFSDPPLLEKVAIPRLHHYQVTFHKSRPYMELLGALALLADSH